MDGADVFGWAGLEVWWVDEADVFGWAGLEVWWVDGADVFGWAGLEVWWVDGADVCGCCSFSLPPLFSFPVCVQCLALITRLAHLRYVRCG